MLEGVWLMLLSLFAAEAKKYCSASNVKSKGGRAKKLVLSLQTLASRLWKISMVGVVSANC